MFSPIFSRFDGVTMRTLLVCRSILPNFAGALVVTVGLAGCGPSNKFQPPPPPTVTVGRPVERELEDWVVFTGATRAATTVELRSRVRGYLHRIPRNGNGTPKDGAVVKEGDLLFVIDQEPFQAEVDAARATLDKAKAALELAKANRARTAKLSADNAISKQQLDVDQAEEATAEANVKSARAALTQAELNLGYTEIRAPMDGRMGRHLVDEGNLVLPDQTLLAVIESIDPMHAYFNVSERELLQIQQLWPDVPAKGEDIPVFMALGDSEDFAFQGKLDFSQLGVDPSTGTTQRRAAFDNPDRRLVPGMFVRVRIGLGKPRPQLLVEQRALGSDQRGDYVLVVDQADKVEYRPVKLGPSAGNLRVIREGLKPNERIVVNGLQRARPNSQVTPEELAAEEPVAAHADPISGRPVSVQVAGAHDSTGAE